MIPVGKYLPVLTLARCHNDSLCVVYNAVAVYTSLSPQLMSARASAAQCVLQLNPPPDVSPLLASYSCSSARV